MTNTFTSWATDRREKQELARLVRDTEYKRNLSFIQGAVVATAIWVIASNVIQNQE